MGWEDDAKVQAETPKQRRAKRATARTAERDELEAVCETAMGIAMAKAVTTLMKFKEVFGNRLVPTRSITGDPAALKQFGVKDPNDMACRVEVVRVAKDRMEIQVDGVKYECDIIYNTDLRRLGLDPKPTRYPNQTRVLHPNHAEELFTGRAFESGLYLGAVAVEWAKKHKFTRVD